MDEHFIVFDLFKALVYRGHISDFLSGETYFPLYVRNMLWITILYKYHEAIKSELTATVVNRFIDCKALHRTPLDNLAFLPLLWILRKQKDWKFLIIQNIVNKNSKIWRQNRIITCTLWNYWRWKLLERERISIKNPYFFVAILEPHIFKQ